MSTDAEGKVALRIGASVLTLSEESGATLQRADDGAHLDLDAGSVYVWSAEGNPLEVHVEGAVAAASWLAPDAGVDSDVRAEDSADHGAARERGFFSRIMVRRVLRNRDGVSCPAWERHLGEWRSPGEALLCRRVFLGKIFQLIKLFAGLA